jgi:hypothetical protein
VENTLEAEALPRPIKIVASGLADVVIVLVPNFAIVGESVTGGTGGATGFVVLAVESEGKILCHNVVFFVV